MKQYNNMEQFSSCGGHARVFHPAVYPVSIHRNSLHVHKQGLPQRNLYSRKVISLKFNNLVLELNAS